MNSQAKTDAPKGKTWFEFYAIKNLASLSAGAKEVDKNGQRGYLELAIKHPLHPLCPSDGFKTLAFLQSLRELDILLKRHFPRIFMYRLEEKEPQLDSFTKIMSKMRSIINEMQEVERVQKAYVELIKL